MDLVKDFDKAMKNIYLEAKRDCGYNAARFLQMLSEKGGLETARTLILKDVVSEGFVQLQMCGRLDLTVEAHVIRKEFRELFTEEEIGICFERLRAYDYEPEE
ncbi:MAG: hypothetical protein K0R93_998 [Anaerosolibacter sp.]|jgi:hypothetical protein|uniref:hypothetical protein n=1 Tax=Anaerosolibacter sp. TaxID=1872527 RepID=UPI002633B99C|nr:hypothetical protein [Anaerosolibacter sp.]MDF2546100.1 hypothetical protein [Anaerosolibacter sp.]